MWSTVAHWCQMDTLHGNECVPTLIGAQGCGKTTFLTRLLIPEGMYIDNSGEIDYDQLYAQVLHELRVKKMPYWFNNSEVARIQELNKNFSAKTDIADIVSICFRKPAEGEVPMSMNCNQLMEIISKKYPTVKSTHSTKIYLGKAMKSLGYESTEWSHVAHYKVIPVKTAS